LALGVADCGYQKPVDYASSRGNYPKIRVWCRHFALAGSYVTISIHWSGVFVSVATTSADGQSVALVIVKAIAFGPIVRAALGSLLEGSRPTATAVGSSSRTL
jgi:hypothetical protein